MWTSNKWFSYRRDDLENAIDKLNEADTHDVGQDGSSIDEGNAENKLKKNIHAATVGNKADVTRSNYVDKNLNPLKTRARGEEGSQESRRSQLKTAVAKMKRAGRAELKYGKDAGFIKTLNDFGKDVREETMVESYLTEGTATHGDFELKVEPKVKRSEGHPSHVIAHVRKMNKLGVPVHSEDDYGDTVAVRVTNTKTKASTLHHVYQRGKSGREDEETKRLVSVRPVGPARQETHEHNEVITDYLSGKRYKPQAK